MWSLLRLTLPVLFRVEYEDEVLRNTVPAAPRQPVWGKSASFLFWGIWTSPRAREVLLQQGLMLAGRRRRHRPQKLGG